MDIQDLFETSFKCHQAGDLEQAGRGYEFILAHNQHHPDALHLLGCIAKQRGDFAKAAQLFRQAICQRSENALYHFNLGCTLQLLGQSQQAIASFEQAIEIDPGAVDSYYYLGVILQGQHNFLRAAECFAKALACNSDFFEARYRRAVCLHLLGDLEAAIAQYQILQESQPENTEVYSAFGGALQAKGDLDGASDKFQKALRLCPQSADAHFNMGHCLYAKGKRDEAHSYFAKALQLDSRHLPSLTNLGIVFEASGLLDEAIGCYKKVLECEPDHLEALNNLGLIHRATGKVRQAIASFEKALQMCPGHAEITKNYLDQLQYGCEWQKAGTVQQAIDSLTDAALREGRVPSETPFCNLMRHPDKRRNFLVAAAYARVLQEKACPSVKGIGTSIFPFTGRRASARGRITIGYLSSDFNDHAVAHILSGVIGRHDRSCFKVICYSCSPDDGSYYRKVIQQSCDEFVDMSGVGDPLEIAERVYSDHVDILVEMNGYTRGGKLQVCAHRPAPVQVSYLGYLGTSGTEFMDYIITDQVVTPDEHIPFYSENFVSLPHCYQVTEYCHLQSSRTFSRSDWNLPDRKFVFCSFNQPYKIDQEIFLCWMRILHKVPESVLWMLDYSELTTENLRKEAALAAIDPQRLIFSGRVTLGEHLARLSLADLALDTKIYNGGATTSNALWAGVPVVTILGDNYVSRMSASNLVAIGEAQLAVQTLGEYEAIAVQLAGCQKEYRDLRLRLQGARKSPLFNAGEYVKDLEKGYKEMWRRCASGEKSRPLIVADLTG